jgi:hypothetical protein
MRLRRPLLSAALLLVPLAWVSRASAQERHLSYELDVRPPLEGDAPLALDFDVVLEVVADPTKTTGHALDASGFARGFRTLGKAAGDLDHIALGVELGGRYLTGGATELSAEQRDYYLHLLDLDPAGGGPGLTSSQEADLNRFTTLQRKYYGYKLLYQHESTQDFTHGQHVLGAQLVGEIPLLHELLDVVPGGTRLESGYAPQPVRLAAGLDWVTGVDSTFAGPADPGAELGRARFEAAWSTKIFDGLPLGVSWQGHYIFSGPEAIEDNGRSFKSFLVAWAMLPLSESGRAGIKIKYLTGRLPPNYESSDGAEIGFSFALY